MFFLSRKKIGSDNRDGSYQLIVGLGKVLVCMAHPCKRLLVETSAWQSRPRCLLYSIIGQLTNRGVIGKSRSIDQKTRWGEKRDLNYLLPAFYKPRALNLSLGADFSTHSLRFTRLLSFNWPGSPICHPTHDIVCILLVTLGMFTS